MGVSQNWGYHFGGPCNKDYNILGSILGSPYFGKLPYSRFHFLFHYPFFTPIYPLHNPYINPTGIVVSIFISIIPILLGSAKKTLCLSTSASVWTRRSKASVLPNHLRIHRCTISRSQILAVLLGGSGGLRKWANNWDN